MSKRKAFRIEVAIDAPLASAWQALTDPAEIRRWHGWDFDGLDEEIRYIYVDHASHVPMERIRFGEESDGWIELTDTGSNTCVTAMRIGTDDPTSHDIIEEGWRAFLQQLRHYLERHCGADRRTLYIEGTAVPSTLFADLHAKVGGGIWHEDRFQRGLATDRYGDGLVLLSATEPIACDDPASIQLTVTTHGLDDTEFASTRDDWVAWSSSHVDSPTVTP